ncbi:MAG: DUF4301 family protein [Nitrospirales bacterium]
MLKSNDHSELEKRNLTPNDLEKQVARLNQGTIPLNIIGPCHLGDGITQLSDTHASQYQQAWAKIVGQGRASKFIPASGAATRMFQPLLQYLGDSTHPTELVGDFGRSLHRFPFFDALSHTLQQQGHHVETLRDSQNFIPILNALLHPQGLNYANLPKALLPFHRYPHETRTALEEHIHDGFRLIRDKQHHIRCHITVSPEHRDPLHQHVTAIKEKWADSHSTVDFAISLQSPETETIALDPQGNIVRTEAGGVLFRPGGHGALLHNLQDSQGDIVLISNIDNVVPDHLKPPVLEWRALLGGCLVTIQARIHSLLNALAEGHNRESILRECETFMQNELMDPLPSFYGKWTPAGQIAFFQGYLNRPIRVCGMVKNTGDPGGGPFWVRDQTGTVSKQIVEQAQIDPHSPNQQKLFKESTHFNPVDMVCGVRNLKGEVFDLTQFVDPNTAFVANKSYRGMPIRVLEWPGLWNGGMANWITIFVEIPRVTFNPVKTYLDWLHPHHQPAS